MGRAVRIAVLVAAVWSLSGCRCSEEGSSVVPAASASDGLTPELRKEVLAKVGDRTITLGEYAAVLRNMDRFERERYQTPERRLELLEELIDAELLAQEAERRGLHRDPLVEAHVRQILREQLLRRVRDEAPTIDAIELAEVRAYYRDHREEFRDPERRRVCHIALKDRQRAEDVAKAAVGASGAEWGRLFQEHSLDAAAEPPDAPELAGDLGIVNHPSSEDAGSERVPPAVRRAVFELKEIGDVLPRPIEDEQGRFHVVRLAGRSPARVRSFEEAERAIRVRLVRAKIAELERSLVAELEKKYPVTIDEEALRAASPR